MFPIEVIKNVIPANFCEDDDDIIDYLSCCMDTKIARGLTRTCLIQETMDIVIKIPHAGEYSQGSFCHFSDYCLQEYNFYQHILKNYPSLVVFFAEVDILDYCKTGAILSQKKVIPWDFDKMSVSPEKYHATSVKYPCPCLNYHWLTRAIEYYGEDLVDELFSFFEEDSIGQTIANDLHSGNIGLTREGAPIILDFAGFED